MFAEEHKLVISLNKHNFWREAGSRKLNREYLCFTFSKKSQQIYTKICIHLYRNWPGTSICPKARDKRRISSRIRGREIPFKKANQPRATSYGGEVISRQRFYSTRGEGFLLKNLVPKFCDLSTTLDNEAKTIWLGMER